MRLLDTLRSVLRFRRPELHGPTRRLTRTADVGDMRQVARRRLPRGVFDYIDGGAEGEVTLRRNTAAFEALELNPRVLRDVDRIDTTATVLGTPLPLPLVLSPTGFTRIVCSEGELAVARAAASAGLPYTLSTLSTRSIEEVAAVSDGRKWLQVYVWRDRALVRDMLDRAARHGYEAIMITVDTAVLGRRERDVRRGFTLPPKVGPGTLVDGALHPAWVWDLLRAEPIVFANIAGSVGIEDGTDAVSLGDFINRQFDPSLSWADIEWFRSVWDGPILLKGIQSVDDARIAADTGIDAIALSNHGGRQLDGSPPPIDLVAPVAQEVGGQIEILCDGGIRRGGDVVKAVALGATAGMIGRPYLYALATGGEEGVTTLLQRFHADIHRTLALVGASSTAELTPDLIR